MKFNVALVAISQDYRHFLRTFETDGKPDHWNLCSYKSTAVSSHRLLYIAFVFLVRLKSFRRWMSETCLPCPPTKFPDNNEPYIFSFYEDIVQVNRHSSSYFICPLLCMVRLLSLLWNTKISENLSRVLIFNLEKNVYHSLIHA